MFIIWFCLILILLYQLFLLVSNLPSKCLFILSCLTLLCPFCFVLFVFRCALKRSYSSFKKSKLTGCFLYMSFVLMISYIVGHISDISLGSFPTFMLFTSPTPYYFSAFIGLRKSFLFCLLGSLFIWNICIYVNTFND